MYAMLSNFKFVLYCFSKIVHYNYGFMLNTSYYFYPTQFILSPSPPPPSPLPKNISPNFIRHGRVYNLGF